MQPFQWDSSYWLFHGDKHFSSNTNLECEPAGTKSKLFPCFQFCQVKCVENSSSSHSVEAAQTTLRMFLLTCVQSLGSFILCWTAPGGGRCRSCLLCRQELRHLCDRGTNSRRRRVLWCCTWELVYAARGWGWRMRRFISCESCGYSGSANLTTSSCVSGHVAHFIMPVLINSHRLGPLGTFNFLSITGFYLSRSVFLCWKAYRLP